MYETSDALEIWYLQRQKVPYVKHDAGIYYFKKTSNLFLALFQYYYQCETRDEYDSIMKAMDALL